MERRLVAVQSLDGYITDGDNPDVSSWASEEDYEHFCRMKDWADVIIMGSGTYDVVKDAVSQDPGTRRIVHTSQPDRYDNEPEHVLFTTDEPHEVLEGLSKDGCEKILVAGGSHVYSMYLQSRCIDELFITIEPVVLGSGRKLLQDSSVLALQFISQDNLNEKGTMLMRYSVVSRV